MVRSTRSRRSRKSQSRRHQSRRVQRGGANLSAANAYREKIKAKLAARQAEFAAANAARNAQYVEQNARLNAAFDKANADTHSGFAKANERTPKGYKAPNKNNNITRQVNLNISRAAYIDALKRKRSAESIKTSNPRQAEYLEGTLFDINKSITNFESKYPEIAAKIKQDNF